MHKVLSYSKRLLLHPLAKGSLIVMFGSLLSNFFNYLFHLLTGRMLGPEKYAIIASLISLYYVISFPSAIINTIVTRKMAALAAKNDHSSIKGIFKLFFKNVFYLNLMVIFGFFIFQKPIAHFLKIEDAFLVFLLGLGFSLALISIVGLATLHGLLKFFESSFLTVLSAFLRDGLAFLAIILGFGVGGIMWGMVLTNIITLGLSFFLLKSIFIAKETRKKLQWRSFLTTSWMIIALLGTSLMINSDVMLVKHFFPSFQAGLYASLSTMGKVVFFASSSVSAVLLPLATKKNESGLSAKKELYLSMFLVFSMSLVLTLVYFVAPRLVITLFYGSTYFAIAPYMGLMAIYFLFYNLTYLFVNFSISLQKRKILLAPFFCALLQITLIFIFHQSFFRVLSVLIASAALLLAIFSLYYLRYEKAGD